jgi:nucleotide-binding universal stress UspA family protein
MAEAAQQRALNILLGFDGSEHSLAAIEFLRDLPLNENSKIMILGVLIPRESSNHAVLASALNQAQKLLQEVCDNIETQLKLGDPAEKIIESAEEIQPDLIVAGAKGLRHTLGIFLGGVAQQIIEYAEQPVLVVRAPYKGLNRLLLVTDGSLSSVLALKYLAGKVEVKSKVCKPFPLPSNTQIEVMHVLPPLPTAEMIARTWPIGPDLIPSMPIEQEVERDWIKEERDQGSLLVENTASELKECLGRNAVPVLSRGDAASEILQYIQDHEIDLIIAGSRGLSEMRSWLLGSVSRKLVHYAGCSVLVVKGGAPK